MTTGRARILPLFTLLAAGCANAEDVSFTLTTDAAPKPDTAVSTEEDTGSTLEDTGAKKDTAVVPADTAVALDTGTTVLDSSAADSSATDSSVVDGSADTSVVVVDSSVVDSDLTDVSDSAVVDTAIEDTGPATTTRLATGTFALYGITTDGYVVYGDAGSTVYAVSLAGGAPQTIGGSVSRVRVSNKAVFVWGTVDTYGFAPLTVWTVANGSKSIATKSLAPSSTASYALWVAAASADGAWAVYTDGGVGGVSDKADIKVVATNGTGAKTVFTQHVVYDGSLAALNDYCAPFMGWVGSRFVTSHCTPSGTSVSFDASSIDPAAGTAASLGVDLGAYWTANDAGNQVALVTSAGSLRLLPVGGGTPLIIDSGVASAQFTHDGTYVLYRTSLNALKRSPTSAASPSSLITSGVATLLSGVSPSDKFMLFSSVTTAGAYNVRLASTTAPGAGTVLYATSAAETYGDTFTSDSAYALYYQSVASDVGTLVAHGTGGGSAIALGTSAWIDFAGTGGKVVWNDGYSATTGRATIRTRDMAGLTGTIVTIAANADANFALTPAKDRVVYTMSGTAAADGLWVAPIP